MDKVWNKPVLTLFRERVPIEKEPFAVVKTNKLGVSKSEKGGYWGNIHAFFILMGSLDYISSAEGQGDSYVLCWFDDGEEDLNKAYRRLTGVIFPSGVPHVVDDKGKRTYDASFKAQHGKLE
jgi:hypothetical protein